MNRRIVPALAALLVVAGLAGCGIQPESSPTAIDRPFQPTTSPTSAPNPAGTIRETLYLVRDGMLVAVTRHVSRPPTVESLLAELYGAPSDTERESGLTSALLGTNPVAAVHQIGTQVVIELAAPVAGSPRTDDQLAFGQIVCTLTSLPDVNTVMFTHNQQPIGVPRGDGSVSTVALTSADYTTMMAPN